MTNLPAPNHFRLPCAAALTLVVALSLALTGLPASAQVIPLSGEFQANQDTTICAQNPKVFARPDGGFGVVWADQSVQGIRGRFYDVDGVPEANEVTLLPDSGVFFEDAAQMPDGGFTVLWSEFGASLEGDTLEGGGDEKIFGLRFAANGAAVGSEFVVSPSSTEVDHASLAVDDLGEFVVAWKEGSLGYGSIEARRFASDGVPLGGQLTVSSSTSALVPEVAKEVDSGEFAVVWFIDGINTDIAARRFTSSGAPVGGEFIVNSYTSGSHRDPDIALSTDGEMLVTWSGPTATSSGNGHIVLAHLDSSGMTEEEVVVSNVGLTQGFPALAASPVLGSYVMGWQDFTEVGGGPLTADPRGAFNLFTDQQLTSTLAGEQTNLAVAIDPAERATVVWLTDPTESGCNDVVGVRGQLIRYLPSGDTPSSVHGATQQVAWRYYLFDPGTPGNYEIRLHNLNGDADLYVALGAIPDLSSYECRPFQGGVTDESCILSYSGVPLAIGINGFQAGTIEFTLSAGPETPLFSDGFESGDTSAWSAMVN